MEENKISCPCGFTATCTDSDTLLELLEEHDCPMSRSPWYSYIFGDGFWIILVPAAFIVVYLLGK